MNRPNKLWRESGGNISEVSLFCKATSLYWRTLSQRQNLVQCTLHTQPGISHHIFMLKQPPELLLTFLCDRAEDLSDTL